jgi:hypothetical protein
VLKKVAWFLLSAKVNVLSPLAFTLKPCAKIDAVKIIITAKVERVIFI